MFVIAPLDMALYQQLETQNITKPDFFKTQRLIIESNYQQQIKMCDRMMYWLYGLILVAIVPAFSIILLNLR